MKELLDLLKSRCSVRSFSDKKVEEDKIDKIIEAGRVAPTACNNQPQRIYLIECGEDLGKLQKCKTQHFNEQLAFLICYNKDECWTRDYDGHKSGEVDASIVATHMMLEAESLGISSTWIMHFIPEAIIKEFKLDKNEVPVALLVMGYKAENCIENPRHLLRKKREEIIK